MRFKWFSMFLFTRVCLMKMITSNGADLKESCSVVQSLSCVQLFASPWTATCQVSLSFTISQSLLRLVSIESMIPSNHLIISCPLLFLPESRSFPMNWLFASHGQSIETSVSVSVLPMNTQDSFPLGWTGWISLQSKGLSGVFSSTSLKASILWCSAFFMVQLSKCE